MLNRDRMDVTNSVKCKGVFLTFYTEKVET